MTSLSKQIAQNASLNASLLVDRSKRKVVQSYLFTGREADQHDLESIHALGVNGLLQLSSFEPQLRSYEEKLFSGQIKMTDRTLLSAQANEDLNKSIEDFLPLLGPYLMEAPTGKVLEWLIRRLRINEFNLEAMLALFLPYHESPHFAKMITILHIKPNSTWSFLLPFMSAAQSLPRVSLVTEMLRNPEVAHFVVALLPSAIKEGHSHRVLLAFSVACLHEFITRNKILDEGTLAFLLPALLEPLQQQTTTPSKDAILGSYILLSALSQRCQLTGPALKTIVGAMASCAQYVATKQFISAAVAVCDQQVELERFSSSILKNIIQISDLANELRTAFAWVGSEKLACPLIAGLVQRLPDKSSFSLLEDILTTSEAPNTVIKKATIALMKQAIVSADPASVTSASRQLLASIHERHPLIMQQAISRVIEEDGTVTDLAENLVMSLTMSNSTTASSNGIESTEMIIALSSADAQVRAIAVKKIVVDLAREDKYSTSDIQLIHSALLNRIQDSDVQVLEALYEVPAAITSVFIRNPETYISLLSQVLTSPEAKPKRSIIRLHLTFLGSHFCGLTDPATLDDVFYKILYPFLLFSRPRQRTADLVWDIISKHLEGKEPLSTSAFELLDGCTVAIKQEQEKHIADVMDMMAGVNMAVSDTISRNILKSKQYLSHFSALITKLSDVNPHTRLLAYLIARALLGHMIGEQQLEAAKRVLDAMSLDEMSGMNAISMGSNGVNDSLDDSFVGKSIVSKPNSKSTLCWLQMSTVGMISGVTRPVDLNVDWLCDLPSLRPDDRGGQYVALMQQIYRLANQPTSLPGLNTAILQLLFVNLKDDALAFLAGIWAGGTVNDLQDIPSIALRHAAAFLEAHVLEDDGVDFQTILPLLLVGLHSASAQVRQGSLECISRLRILTERKLTSIYKFDAIYGQDEGELQYLDHKDLIKYLDSLVEHREHFTYDATYLRVFHNQHLQFIKGDKKRNNEYRRRILCYLLSHINALSLCNAQTILLRSIEALSDKAKAQVLYSTIHSLLLKASSAQPESLFGTYSEEFAVLILSCFDTSIATDLNDQQSVFWDDFTLAIKSYFNSGIPSAPQVVLSNSLKNGLFAALNHERKTAICELLMNAGTRDPDIYEVVKKLLTNILQDIPIITHLLDLSVPVTSTAGLRPSKRTKTMESSSDDYLPRLSLLVEVLGTKSLPGSLDLISQLLETLNKILQTSLSNQADITFIEQHLMSAIENSAEKIYEISNLSPSFVRLDILVELIRIADNPQTFHQALLLMANLARLAPESVLHNVMPVFTFMGSNVFHRDDTYSFRVVQQTVDSIVPVMVSSLKNAHTQPLDLFVASKQFLRVFTDASNHIPRHRRNNFFSHLVDVLGAKDFLAPVCMLLVEKVANKAVRQTSDEVQNSLSLPLYIIQHQSRDVQIDSLIEVAREAIRLMTLTSEPEEPLITFLDNSMDGDHTTQTFAVLKRRTQALIIFIGLALKPSSMPTTSEKESLGTLVSNLILLVTRSRGADTELELNDIHQATRTSLNLLLSALSAVDFVASISSVLKSGEITLQEGAYNLLSQRIADISTKIRQEITPSIITIVESIKKVLMGSSAGSLPIYALQALRSIVLTLSKNEESAVVDTLPMILKAIKDPVMVSPALTVLVSISTKIGPRIIPYFRDIVEQVILILNENKNSDVGHAVLSGLLISIPAFWGDGEVTKVAKLIVENHNHISSSTSSLAKSFTKKIPPKVLLPALTKLWTSINTSSQTVQMGYVVAFFELLSRALRNAPQAAVLENLRTIFNTILESLDIVKDSPKDDNKGEAQVIATFKELVVKLNETAFRPLFRRLYDWAFASSNAEIARQITFCHMYSELLDFFKTLMTPYMSFLLQPFIDILKAFIGSVSDNVNLWKGIINIISKSFVVDDGVFWRDDKLKLVTPHLVAQAAVSIRLCDSDGKQMLQESLIALTDTVSDDLMLKTINLDLLMNSRSEEVQLRIYALSCSEAIWRAQGGKLLGFVAETATFIAECSEDENDMVVKESFRLKDAVESVAGKIDGL